MKNKITLFFIIGITLYLIDVTLNSYDEKEIYISDQEIISLVNAWKSQVGRNPNDDEITRIINNLVEEEILYREALALGLEQNDRIIKRRLAQKISFLKQESVQNRPSKEELLDYFKKNEDKYYVQSTYTFTHYFFSSDNNSQFRSSNAYIDIYDNKDIVADPFFLGKNFVDVSIQKIEIDFGRDFSLNFNDIELNKWTGPFQSAYGHHIVFVKNYVQGYLPDIISVLKQVEVDYLQTKKDEAVKEYLKQLRSGYKIYINPNLKI